MLEVYPKALTMALSPDFQESAAHNEKIPSLEALA